MQTPNPDAAAIELFRRQHGYALVSDLYKLGLTKDQIAYRVAKGIYTRVAYGVVALGTPTPTPCARAMRGVLIAGRSAVASLWTAAELHGLDAPRDTQVHVVVRSSRRIHQQARDIYVHRTRFLPAPHVVSIHSVPATSLPRTIVDCAQHLDHWSALRVLDSASASAAVWRSIHLTCEELSNGRAGVRAIAAATAPDGVARLRSRFERTAQDLLQTYNLPAGEWNVTISDSHGRIREVDLCYPDARLIVEFDGLRFHTRRDAARRDRATDRRLQLAGWTVLRFTWEEIVFRPEAVAKELAQALLPV
jgi:hypothetical protein